MPHTVQKNLAGCSVKFLCIGVLVTITTLAFVSILVLFVFLPQDGFGTPAGERSASEVVVNATGIDNPAKASLPEKPESKK